MALGWGPAAAEDALESTLAVYKWVQLHVGPPGPSGVANVAQNNVRQQVAVAAASSGGGVASIASSGVVSWTNVAASETYTHATLWTAAAVGNFGGSGTVLANPVSAGDDFSFPISQVVAQLPLAT